MISISHGFRAIETPFSSHRFDSIYENFSTFLWRNQVSEPANFPAIQIETRICGIDTKLSWIGSFFRSHLIRKLNTLDTRSTFLPVKSIDSESLWWRYLIYLRYFDDQAQWWKLAEPIAQFHQIIHNFFWMSLDVMPKNPRRSKCII